MSARQDEQPANGKPSKARIKARSKTIRQELARLDFVLTGTLHHRTKVCGKPSCRCATDPEARHGPYYEWGRMRNKKLVQNTVTPQQAELIRHGIDNHHRAQTLLAEWERLSEAEILNPSDDTDE